MVKYGLNCIPEILDQMESKRLEPLFKKKKLKKNILQFKLKKYFLSTNIKNKGNK